MFELSLEERVTFQKKKPLSYVKICIIWIRHTVDNDDLGTPNFVTYMQSQRHLPRLHLPDHWIFNKIGNFNTFVTKFFSTGISLYCVWYKKKTYGEQFMQKLWIMFALHWVRDNDLNLSCKLKRSRAKLFKTTTSPLRQILNTLDV